MKNSMMMNLIPNQNKIQTSYIVCSTGRSGSTLLCRTLEHLKCCGNPEEYFHHKRIKGLKLKDNPENFINYCNKILQEGLTSNGVFGIKLHYWQMYDLIKMAKGSGLFKEKEDLNILNAIFPDLKFIYIKREDIIAQAVSTTIALQTGVWQVRNENQNQEGIKTQTKSTSNKSFIKFQPLKIYSWEEKFKDQNQRWLRFFEENNIKYYPLTYEILINSFETEIENIINFLDIEQNLIHNKIEKQNKRQSNEINQRFIRNYKMLPKLLLKVVNKVVNA